MNSLFEVTFSPEVGRCAIVRAPISDGATVLVEEADAVVCTMLISDALTPEARALYTDGMDAWQKDCPSRSADWQLTYSLINKGKDRRWASGFLHESSTSATERERMGHATDEIVQWIIKKTRAAEQDVLDVYAAVRRNAFNLTAFLLGHGYACGFYPIASALNHSCDPNCAYTFNGARLVLHALRDIAVGEELTHAYCGLNVTLRRYVARQNYIRDSLGFVCKCTRCEREAAKGDDTALTRFYFPSSLVGGPEPPNCFIAKVLESSLARDYPAVIKEGDHLFATYQKVLIEYPFSAYEVVRAYVQAFWNAAFNSQQILSGKRRSLAVRLLIEMDRAVQANCPYAGVRRYVHIYCGIMFFMLAEETETAERMFHLLQSLSCIERWLGGSLQCLSADVVMAGPGLVESVRQYATIRGNPSGLLPASVPPPTSGGLSGIPSDLGGLIAYLGTIAAEQALERRRREAAMQAQQAAANKTPEPAAPEPALDDLTPKARSELLRKQGNEEYRNHKVASALILYDQALALDPESVPIHLNRAAVFLDIFDYPACIKACSTAIQLGRAQHVDPHLLAKAYTRLGDAKAGEGNKKAALASYRLALVESESAEIEARIRTLEMENKQT